MKTIFIVGAQRSGTTLLSVMLGKHPDILMEDRAVSFRMITAFKHAVEILPYNLLEDRTAFYTWLVENDYKGRLASLLDLEHIDDYATIKELIAGSITKKLQATGNSVWGDKAPNLQLFLADLLMLVPEAKIVHIVRDGRANAYSIARRSYQNLLWSAQQWVDVNVVGLVNRDLIGADRYHFLKYEDLLLNTETSLKGLCGFLDLPFSEQMLALSDGTLSEEKRYVKSQLDTAKIDEFRSQLSTGQLKKIERIQGPLLQTFGYQLTDETALSAHRPLGVARNFSYHQIANFKMLFRSRQKGMRQRENVEIQLPFRNRAYNFLFHLGQDLLATRLVRAIFRRRFYKQKYFRKEE